MAPGADGEQGQPKKKVKKTLMYDTPSGVTDALELIKQKAEQAAAQQDLELQQQPEPVNEQRPEQALESEPVSEIEEPKRRVAKTLMFDPGAIVEAAEAVEAAAAIESVMPESAPSTVPEAQAKRRVPRTMLFTPTPDLMEAAAAVEAPAIPGQRRISTRKIAKTLVFGRDQYIEETETLAAPNAMETTEPVQKIAEPQAREAEPPQVPVVKVRKMRGEQYVAKTMLDHSMLFDQVSRSHLKQEEKAIELAKERAHEPVVPFVPIVCKKKALACPWTWDETYSTDRYRYCGSCQRPVYNFAGLEIAEAEAIILKAENRSKFTLYQRTDGKFMTGNCPTAIKKRSDTILMSLAVLLVVVGLLVYMAMLPHPKAQMQSTSSGSSAAQAPGAVAQPTHYVPGSPRLTPLGSKASGGSSHYDPVTKKMVVDVAAPVAAPAPVANTSGPDETQQDWEFNTPQK